MGISSLPAASEGVLCVLLVSTAFSIHILKCIIRSILHIVGINLSSSSPPSSSSSSGYIENRLVSFDVRLGNADSYIEEFRTRIPTIRFDAVECPEPDCSVCLTQFEPESEIYRLSCDHIFHKVCMEKWLNYWNVTCPLCRTYLLPEDDPSSSLW